MARFTVANKTENIEHEENDQKAGERAVQLLSIGTSKKVRNASLSLYT